MFEAECNRWSGEAVLLHPLRDRDDVLAQEPPDHVRSLGQIMVLILDGEAERFALV